MNFENLYQANIENETYKKCEELLYGLSKDKAIADKNETIMLMLILLKISSTPQNFIGKCNLAQNELSDAISSKNTIYAKIIKNMDTKTYQKAMNNIKYCILSKCIYVLFPDDETVEIKERKPQIKQQPQQYQQVQTVAKPEIVTAKPIKAQPIVNDSVLPSAPLPALNTVNEGIDINNEVEQLFSEDTVLFAETENINDEVLNDVSEDEWADDNFDFSDF